MSQKGAQASASVSVASRTNSRFARNSFGSFLDSLGGTIVRNVPAKVRPAPNVFFITQWNLNGFLLFATQVWSSRVIN